MHGCGASRWTTGPAPTPAKDLTHSGSFPLSAVTSARLLQVTFAPPRIIYGQAQDNRAHSSWPGPGPPRTTNKVTGQVVFAPLMMSLSFSVGVCPFKTMRGRRLRRSWMAWIWASVMVVKLVPLGR